jgi:hypothetical protein
MANATTYTITIHLDPNPDAISWLVTDLNMSKILVKSELITFQTASPYDTVRQTFTLPDNQSYIFEIRSSLSNGIHCNHTVQQPQCYTVTGLETVTMNEKLFLSGYGEFSCSERYKFGINEPRMQKPFFQGCQSPLQAARRPLDYDLILLGTIISGFVLLLLVAVVWHRRETRLQVMMTQEETALDSETERKLYSARKESLFTILKKQGWLLVSSCVFK